MKDKYHFQCIDCGAEYGPEKPVYLCPACANSNSPGQPPKGVLKTLFDYEGIKSAFQGKDLFRSLEDQHFLPLMPLESLESWPSLRIGGTPLYKVALPAAQPPAVNHKPPTVFLKDDSQNPTFSFKDRASALVSAWAKERGIGTLVAASTGNAGSSLAGICASMGQKAIIVVPAAAPLAKLTQVLMYGATLVPVKGTYDDAFGLSIRLTERFGWYNRNTAFNPLTIEGKKTVSFEIYSQLGFRVPDRIFIPTGDGVICSGVMKGFEDLLKLGITDRMPAAVAVQSEGSPNVFNNLGRDDFNVTPSRTIADSISVDVPQCYRMTAGYLEQYHGEAITVTDDEILRASVSLAGNHGLFAEPAASAAFAGMMKYSGEGRIADGSVNVVLLTGSGLKDLKSVQPVIRIPEPIDPDPDMVEKFLKAVE